MREVSARLGAGNPQHFALMSYELDEQRDLMRSRFEGKYGIRPVFYRISSSNGAQDHSDLRRVLDRLYEQVSGHPVSRGAQVKPPAAEPPRYREESLSVESPESDTAETPTVFDTLDQQKGRWGGRPETETRKIRVEGVQDKGKLLLCTFDLVVEAKAGATKPLAGDVEFHLHQTFKPNDMRLKKAVDGEARLTLTAYGAFTVGVKADGGETRLELDLSQVEDFPQWFRER